jgi:hypothetical protein
MNHEEPLPYQRTPGEHSGLVLLETSPAAESGLPGPAYQASQGSQRKTVGGCTQRPRKAPGYTITKEKASTGQTELNQGGHPKKQTVENR